MRQSKLFTKTQREAPSDEESKNAQLLIRAGFIHKEMAGVYTLLPLGLRVLKNIEQIIREEMNAIGGQEMFMTTLQNPEIWKKTDRWIEEENDAKGLPWFKTQLSNGTELGIASTHEEDLTNILTQHISSYKDLPVYPYQFQNKFRNELRAKSGIMRTREFIMKDMYSFSRGEDEFREFYEICAAAYLKIFARFGLGDRTFRTFASGGAFSKFSDEFQTLSDAGEDTVFIDRKKNLAVNKEVYSDEILDDLGLEKENLEQAKSIEVGNIFPLKTKYAAALGLRYRDEKGVEQIPIMGCYGIGLGRAMGTIVEVLHDEKGIVWPASVAPFDVHLLSLPGGEKEAESLHEKLQDAKIEVLFDDRDETSAGEKFADADLLGIPYRVLVSEKSLQEGGVEVKRRIEDNAQILAMDKVVSALGKE